METYPDPMKTVIARLPAGMSPAETCLPMLALPVAKNARYASSTFSIAFKLVPRRVVVMHSSANATSAGVTYPRFDLKAWLITVRNFKLAYGKTPTCRYALS